MEKNLKSLWKTVFFIICKKSRGAYLFICVNIYLKSLRVSFIFFFVQDTYCRYIKIFSSCLCLSQKQNDRIVSIMILPILTVTLKLTKFQNHSQSIIEVVTSYRQNKQTNKKKNWLFSEGTSMNNISTEPHLETLQREVKIHEHCPQ